MKNPLKSLRRKSKVNKEEPKEERKEASDENVRAGPPTPTLGGKVDSAERGNIIEWIRMLPSADKHLREREGWVEGTGEWLLRDNRYREWRTSAGSQLLWLHGDPGVGKTKLVSTVIDDLEKQLSKNEALAYFYCDRKHSEREVPDSVRILSSFVRQLSRLHILLIDGAIPRSMVEIFRERRYSSLFFQHTLYARESQTILPDLFQISPHTVLVVDALDECDETTRSGLIQELNDLITKSSSPVKILVSSRRDTNSQHQFKNELNIDIRESDNRDDIAMFLKHETIVKREHWAVQMRPELEELVCNTLIERSEGMFRWVAMQISILRDLIRERDIRDWIKTFENPEPLEAEYGDIYHKIQSQKGYKSTVANRALQWIMCSCRPLTPTELIAAVRQDPDTDEVNNVRCRIDSIISNCQNLLVVDQKLQVCRLSHFSVGQYLENHHWSSREPDLLAAKVCLSLLISDSATSGPDIPPRTEESKNGNPNVFLEYARRNYETHLQRLNGVTDARLDELLERFDKLKKSS